MAEFDYLGPCNFYLINYTPRRKICQSLLTKIARLLGGLAKEEEKPKKNQTAISDSIKDISSTQPAHVDGAEPQ